MVLITINMNPCGSKYDIPDIYQEYMDQIR